VSYLAAPAFAAAVLRREVIGAIPVNRRVLLIAEVPVGVGSTVDGGTVRDVHDLDGVRVIGLIDASGVHWSPPAQHPLTGEDRLIVVATRDGLGQAVTRTTV
jgi:hypothetical protein